MSSWEVHKFGGTSVENAQCMRNVIEIMRPMIAKTKVAVVVSAMGGKPKVTDLLLDSVHGAAAGQLDVSEKCLQLIYKKHEDCTNDLFQDNISITQTILARVAQDLKDIRDLLRAVTLMRMAHEQILELVSGYGEVMLLQ
jgi:aspartokinase/homoserine dehydrogenase 1